MSAPAFRSGDMRSPGTFRHFALIRGFLGLLPQGIDSMTQRHEGVEQGHSGTDGAHDFADSSAHRRVVAMHRTAGAIRFSLLEGAAVQTHRRIVRQFPTFLAQFFAAAVVNPAIMPNHRGNHLLFPPDSSLRHQSLPVSPEFRGCQKSACAKRCARQRGGKQKGKKAAGTGTPAPAQETRHLFHPSRDGAYVMVPMTLGKRNFEIWVCNQKFIV